MTVTCASCGAEVGDVSSCPRCGAAVLSPQSGERAADRVDWRTDTAERPAARPAVEPASAPRPTPARYPLYADDLDVAAHADTSSEPRAPDPPASSTSAPAPVDDAYDEEDDDHGSRAAVWVAWGALAVVLVLVAAAGVWLLFSPGDGELVPATPVETRSAPRASDEPRETGETGAGTTEVSDPSGEPAPVDDPVDVGSTAVASAPRTAPPNADAFGNRTTYDAANMLDGQAQTCWRTAGDATGLELTFQLAAPTSVTRVGMINGYAKNAVVGGRNLNWYVGNRRVLMAQWVFDDGSTVDQPLGATKQMQTIDLGSPVTTSTVRLRLVSVSSPGTGRSARDYTAVSEVALVGVPAA